MVVAKGPMLNLESMENMAIANMYMESRVCMAACQGRAGKGGHEKIADPSKGRKDIEIIVSKFPAAGACINCKV
jgi:hypothetical protein